MTSIQHNTKLALLIGINYYNTDSQLNGCINDVCRMKTFLIKHCGFLEENIKVLTDDTETKPTTVNILKEIGRLVAAAHHDKTNEIFIHYSGHGTSIDDKNNDENDNKDEALVPLDYKTNGFITDDLLNDYFAYLPATCKCICLFDCCHSGTILDLTYRYVDENDNETENNKSKVKSNIIMISGCKDVQTSADALINNKWAGAMTCAFLDTMEKYNYNVTCFHLLNGMRLFLQKSNYEQVPQICSSNKLNNTSLFACYETKPEPYFICN